MWLFNKIKWYTMIELMQQLRVFANGKKSFCHPAILFILDYEQMEIFIFKQKITFCNEKKTQNMHSIVFETTLYLIKAISMCKSQVDLYQGHLNSNTTAFRETDCPVHPLTIYKYHLKVRLAGSWFPGIQCFYAVAVAVRK